jgi:hypothetical protein
MPGEHQLVKEATIRDVLLGATPPGSLAAEARDAVEPVGRSSRRVHIEDLPAGEETTVTPEMLVRLCDAALAGSLPASALEPIAFAIVASEHFRWDDGDDVVGRVLYDWASPEINFELTAGNLRMFRDWLTGKVRPPSEPDVTADTLSELGFPRRTSKVRVIPSPTQGA